VQGGTVANPFVHVELNTPDPQKAKSFYAKLFQWQLEDVPNPAAPGGDYTMVKVGTGTGDGSDGHGLVQLHSRPDRRAAGIVAEQV
jgi:predicted enzyme related to lactoylglutathione lyase